MAVRTSITEGSDVSNLIVNAAFDADANFKGWIYEISKRGQDGSNFSSNSGFTDIYPVAGTWNTAFDLWQDMEEGLPNGIYELEAPAFYRPGPNGRGDLQGLDYVPASLYINDYSTPVMNIYTGRVLYADAVNGVNCRYDAANDENAPHNGEYTTSQDFDTGDGYVPEQRQAMSFAFAGGRYINHAYAIVEDGKIRLGIRNMAKPWNESGMTMWGKFRLTYRGHNEQALTAMMDNLDKHRRQLDSIRVDCEYFYSMSHTTRANQLLQQARNTADINERMSLVKQANAEISAVPASVAIYDRLTQLKDYLYTQAGELSEDDMDKAELLYAAGDQLDAHVVSGDLTDEECEALYLETLNRIDLGGSIYVQGDLVDADGNALTYGKALTQYPLTRQADGTWTGTFKTQDRSNRPNSEARAGIYFTQMNVTYRATDALARFITPACNTFALAQGGSQDYQTVGGEFRVTVDPAQGTVTFEPITCQWSDYVYVSGTVLDSKGERHDWKNDEVVPLKHQGEGVYEGQVTFFHTADAWDGNATFTIWACRSTSSDIPFSQMTRANWTEARYGSATDATLLQPDSTLTDLVRGMDRKWMVPMDEAEETATYTVRFDMNHGTVTLTSSNPDAIDQIEGDSTNTPAHLTGIYTLTGQRVQKAQHGLYIINGRKVLVK